MLTRRHSLLALTLATLGPFRTQAAAPAHRDRLLTAWQSGDACGIGVLGMRFGRAEVHEALTVPTRAHGLLAEPGGQVLAVARRPGDWLLRWQPASGRTQWQWIEDDRRFNGHVIGDPDGRWLWTTETDLETAQGRLVRRDARSLAKRDDWPTQGMDPHELIALPEALGDLPAGALLVANGGIPTLPETGRSKRALDRMDASLVAIDPHSGGVHGQWRASDPFLSLRHLAWDPVSRTLGIALQAEHPDKDHRLAAPVLAIWDGRALALASGQPALQGYGGDICALPGGGFAVSCPRAGAVALFDARGQWQHSLPLPDACALAGTARSWMAAGSARLHTWQSGGEPTRMWLPPGLRPDNHAVLLAAV